MSVLCAFSNSSPISKHCDAWNGNNLEIRTFLYYLYLMKDKQHIIMFPVKYKYCNNVAKSHYRKAFSVDKIRFICFCLQLSHKRPQMIYDSHGATHYHRKCCRSNGITELHYNDVIMSKMTSQITDLTIVYWTVYLSSDLRKYQISAPLAFVRGVHRWPVSSPHKGPVTRKMFPFDDVIMIDHLNTTEREQYS